MLKCFNQRSIEPYYKLTDYALVMWHTPEAW